MLLILWAMLNACSTCRGCCCTAGMLPALLLPDSPAGERYITKETQRVRKRLEVEPADERVAVIAQLPLCCIFFTCQSLRSSYHQRVQPVFRPAE